MVTTLAVTRATPTPSSPTSRSCADGWKTDLEGGHVTLVAIGELKGNLTSNKWWMRSSSPVSPTTAARRLPMRVTPSPYRRRSACAPRATRRKPRPRCKPRLKSPWTRYTETSATPPVPPFTRGTRTGKFTITPTFWLENSRKIGRPPSFGASTATVAETPDIDGSLSERPRGRRDWPKNSASGSTSESNSRPQMPLLL